MIKGIILAGGAATRLYPATEVISKQLLPIYDKPMIYYPLSILMLMGIQDILLISTPTDIPLFKKLLKDGSQWGINLSYALQEKPEGLAQAFTIGKSFIGNDSCCLILGDNIFYGHDLMNILQNSIHSNKGATIFAYKVNRPERYGIVEFDASMKPKKIIEKPTISSSRYAVTGLYIYNNDVIQIAESLKPSSRGELEITDINKIYLERNLLDVNLLSRGIAWLDTGTFESLLEASRFIETVQKRQGVKIACLEEIAYRMGYLSIENLKKTGEQLKQNNYGQYLLDIVEEENNSR
jgi:glucose-1-phosphate thymidylyltransferase